MALAALVPAIAFGLEGAALAHRLLIDVQGNRDLVLVRIADRVVLVWRQQAAGGAGTGHQGFVLAETAALAGVFFKLVAGDLQLALPDAFDAPQAAMIVNGRALPRRPGHRHDSRAALGAGIEFTASIVTFDRLEHAVGQEHHFVADQPAQAIAQGMGERFAVGLRIGLIDNGEQSVTASEGQSVHGDSLQPGEEAGDGRAEAFDVDQKSVVTLWRFQRRKASIGAASTQAIGDLLLLLERK